MTTVTIVVTFHCIVVVLWVQYLVPCNSFTITLRLVDCNPTINKARKFGGKHILVSLKVLNFVMFVKKMDF